VGIPVAHLAALYHVANLVGSNRVVKAEATTHPLGKPEVSLAMEKASRRRYVEKTLQVLQEEVKEKTIFSIDG
jgi:glycine/betaine/sarcosine/D-proline reductase family selenoprotein B